MVTTGFCVAYCNTYDKTEIKAPAIVTITTVTTSGVTTTIQTTQTEPVTQTELITETEPVTETELIIEPEPELEPMPETEPVETSYVYLSDADAYYLAVMLTHECSSLAEASHNAHSVAAMVNRFNRGDSSSIYSAIASSCSPYWGYGHGAWCMDNGCMNGIDSSYAYEAIDYYIDNANSYDWVTGWEASGDGIYNLYY